MFTKTTGLFIVPTWLAAMSWLFAHDVWPLFAARDLPRLQPSAWLREEGRRAQFEIHHKGIHIGTLWTEHRVGENVVSREDLIWLEQPTFLRESLRVRVSSTFSPEGLLDEFTFRFETGTAREFTLHGERFPSDFSFELTSGPIGKAFKVPLVDGGLISGAFTPFGDLGELHVGQTWKMQVFNPITGLTGVGKKFTSVLVEVTGEENIVGPDGVVKCFVVEASGAKAWLDENGAVILQEVEVPLMGTIRISRALEFDEAMRNEIDRRTLEDYLEPLP